MSVARNRIGFSLLEMLIALAIAGILLAIGIVQLRPTSSRLLANDIKAQIEQARFEAIKRNGPVAVVWESEARRFVTRLDPTTPTVAAACVGSSVLQVRRIDEYRSVQIIVGASDEWPGEVVWLPSGQGRTCTGNPAIGGSITVNDGRTTRVVDVSVGGRVSVR